MKSLDEISKGILSSIQNQISEVKPIKLPSRPCPLDGSDIDKMEMSIKKYFNIERKPVYGYVKIKDENGDFFREEFDIVGQEEVYEKIQDFPEQLKDALLRPAERKHIAFHLTRLAAHLHDTRGKEALSAVIEDIARDIEGMSEWAIILSCRELRNKGGTWYPTTSEIIKTINKNQDKLDSFFVKYQPIAEEKPMKLEHKPLSQSDILMLECKSLPQDKWTIDHWNFYVSEAENMISIAEKNSDLFKVEDWRKETERRKLLRETKIRNQF